MASPNEPERRVVRFRPRGSLFAPRNLPPPSPVADLDKFERSEPEDDQAYHHRMMVNGLAAVVIVVLVGAGWWIADSMARMRKNQDCYLAGRRNCTPISVPVPER